MYGSENEKKELKCVTADVEDVIYFNEDTDYIVLEMSQGDILFTATGNMGDVRAGERLTMYGEYVSTVKYGEQFRVEIFERTVPEDINAIRKYLGSGVIKGVGPSLAGKIVNAFGDKALEVIENDPLRLACVNGIPADRAKRIGEEFQSVTGLRRVMTFFSKYNIPHYVISSAWSLYGGDLIRAVRDNPYCLCGKGIEMKFSDAEVIARDMDFPADSEERVCACIIWKLREYADDGNCCARESDLANSVTQELLIADKLYYGALKIAEGRGDVLRVGLYQTSYVYLA